MSMDYIIYMQFNSQQNWQDLDTLTGKQIHLLHKPKTIQQSLYLLNAHRHLIQRSIILKGINQSLSYLLGTFSNLSLQIEYLSFARQHNLSSNELPRWKDIFSSWIDAKQQGQIQQDNLISFVTISNSTNYFDCQEVHIVFLHHIAENILEHIVNKKIKLADVQKINFAQQKIHLQFTIVQIVEFLDVFLPRTLMNFVMKRQELPLSLQNNKQLQCLYSNKQMEYVIKRSPNYSTLIMALLKIVLINLKQLNKNQQKLFMDVVMRYFYLHHREKKYKTVQIFILAFNNISEPVRFALTNQFILFLHIAKKIGKDKFVQLLLQKSNWLSQIFPKNNNVRKMIGYRISNINPFSTHQFGEKILIDRGNSVLRYFQCVEDHSILFLRVKIESLNIKIRIKHVGDCTNPNNQSIFEVIQMQKAEKQQYKNIILPQKGIYSIEFDNTQSWINSKTVIYQKVVINPLSIKSNNQYNFINNYYLLQEINTVNQKYLMKYSNNQNKPKMFINKRKGLYRLVLGKDKQNYQYQTDNSGRFLQKIHQFSQLQTNYEFYIENNLIKDINQIEYFVNEGSFLSEEEKRKKNAQVLIEIPLQY